MTVSPLAQATAVGVAPPSPGRRGAGRSRLSISPRLGFLLRRLGRLVISLVVVVVATFLIIHLVPGDPVRAALGPSASPELVAGIRAELGLDKPIAQQFVDYIGGLLRGDLGVSISTQRSVGETIAQRFPATLTLAVLAFVVALLGALVVGILSAVSVRSGRHRASDNTFSGFLGMLIAVPDFLLAVGLIALFSVTLGWLPAAGWGDTDQVVLPVLALALGPMAYLSRIVQVEMIGVLDSTYMITARSKRLPSRLVYLRHALPNIVTASLTVGGLLLSGLTAATVLIETVFAIPGMGQATVAAVGGKDYPMIQGFVLVYALTVLGINLVVDLILITMDPRSSIVEG
jgi:peptide/nickel transport system permease protein